MELNENRQWRALYGRALRDDRMRDLELILRFFALSSDELQTSTEFPTQISLKKYLNQYMDKTNKPEHIDGLRARFNRAIEFAFKAFGDGAFHNLSPTEQTRLVEKFSPTVFDSVLIAIDRFIQIHGVGSEIFEGLETKRRQLLTDQSYQQILSQETMRTPNIRSRVNRMFEALFGDIR